MNKCFFIGRMGKDPDLRFTTTGRAVCSFSIATSERYKQNDEWKESTTWINIVAWGKLGERCGGQLTKGDEVFVEGKIQNRSYDDKSGNKRYVTEIIAADVRFCGKISGDGATSEANKGTAPGGAPLTDDEIPF